MAIKKKKYFKPGNNLSYGELAVMYKSILSNEYEKNADLVLPLNSKFSFFGNKAAFCQLINTWFAKNPNSNIRIYDNYFPNTDPDINTTIKKVVEDAELPTLLGLCYGIYNKILGYSNEAKEYTTYFSEPVKNRLIVDYRELNRDYSDNESFSNEYFQIHPDFFENFFIYNLTFYLKVTDRGKFFLQKEEKLNEISAKLFRRLQILDERVSLGWLKNLQTFVYEVFDNAFWWGRINWKISDDTLVEKSNRLFFISSKNYTNILRDNKYLNSNLDEQLISFAKQNSTASNWGTDTKLVELSILDNGNGIVPTFKKDVDINSISILDEYQILMNAFAKGSTSDRSYKGPRRGIGLYKVVGQSKSIFLIIRTGHLHLYRNFETHPFNEEEPFFLFDASDSVTEKEDAAVHIKKNPLVRGVLFSFIIPLQKNVS